MRDTPGQEHGAFTAALLDGLRGAGCGQGVVVAAAVLRGAVGAARRLRQAARRGRRRGRSADTPTRPLLQIPQDTGSRGVAGRERDACSPRSRPRRSRTSGSRCCSTPTRAYRDGRRARAGRASATSSPAGRRSPGSRSIFYLRPGTYALRAAAPEIGEGRVTEPVELYEPLAEPPTIALRPIEEPPPADAPPAPPSPRRRPSRPRPPLPVGRPARSRERSRSRRPTRSASSRSRTRPARSVQVGRLAEPSRASPGLLPAAPRRPRATLDRRTVDCARSRRDASGRCELTRRRARRRRRWSCSRRWAASRRRATRSSSTAASRGVGADVDARRDRARARARTAAPGTAALGLPAATRAGRIHAPERHRRLRRFGDGRGSIAAELAGPGLGGRRRRCPPTPSRCGRSARGSSRSSLRGEARRVLGRGRRARARGGRWSSR